MCIRNTPPTTTIFKTEASIFDHLCHVLLPFNSHQRDQRSSNLKTPSKPTSRTVKTKGGVFGQVDGAEMLQDQYRIMDHCSLFMEYFATGDIEKLELESA